MIGYTYDRMIGNHVRNRVMNEFSMDTREQCRLKVSIDFLKEIRIYFLTTKINHKGVSNL